MTPPGGGYDALVLAADRGPNDPVARAAGVPCKALAPLAGRAMVLRVLDALQASRSVRRVLLCGPPREILEGAAELHSRLQPGQVDWIAPERGPSASAAAGLAALGGQRPVLLTTADHALLQPVLVDRFAELAAGRSLDAAVGLVEYETVRRAWPDTRRTVTRLRGGGYCGTNLFAFPDPAGRRLVERWQRVEAQRKRPWRVIAGMLGPLGVLAYLTGTLTLEQALARLSRRLDLRLGAVLLDDPEAAVDVDTPEDLRLAEAVLERRVPGAGPDR